MSENEHEKTLKLTLENDDDEYFTVFVGIKGVPGQEFPDDTMSHLIAALKLLRVPIDREFSSPPKRGETVE